MFGAGRAEAHPLDAIGAPRDTPGHELPGDGRHCEASDDPFARFRAGVAIGLQSTTSP
ncbi:MAG: hypothetical protein J4O01_03010 [Chloroflexi bacterium]|nr:hypothetical protein [Chloroflexota bacterium]MCH8114495.1 hypothetical protein [Chloroflexota bacterium]MCI0774495.1 hypothetical protein [Chloroflexota bacterium]MCI0834013.1 hypothetical protein [Chloroflexota bacterium]MCI0836442.1 hypothetical protein [Chloroflexota bacterium]